MSKTLLPTLLLLTFCLVIKAQTSYEVITISGTVVNKTEKDTLMEGSMYDSDAELAFESEEDFMGVLDEDGNTFLVYLQPDSDSIAYEPLPEAEGSRRGEIINSIAMILHFAEHTQYLIMGDEMHIKVSTIAFPMNNETFFYIRYLYKGGENINKQLPFDSNYIKIEQMELFSAKYKKSELLGPSAIGDTVLTLDPSLATDFQFRYYNANEPNKHNTFLDPDQPDDQKQRQYIPFNPAFLNHPSLVNEIKTAYQSIQKTRADQEQKNHLLVLKKYIEDKYQGQVYLPNLESWMQKRGILE